MLLIYFFLSLSLDPPSKSTSSRNHCDRNYPSRQRENNILLPESLFFFEKKKKKPRTLKSHFAGGTSREFFERWGETFPAWKNWRRGGVGSTSLVESYPRRKLIPGGRKYRLRFRFLVPLFSRASRKTPVQKTMDVVSKFL